MRILYATLCLALPVFLLPVRAEARSAASTSGIVSGMFLSPNANRAWHPRWSLEVQHLDWRTASRVVRVERHSYPLLHSEARPIGHTTRVIHQSPHIVDKVRWPVFQQPKPVGYQMTLSVSAYAPGCGASGAMADGQWPFVGAAAATLPFGTHLTVPGFGAVTVLDRGVPSGYLDLYVGSCSQAMAWGRQLLTVTVYP